jgi:hypothetical protein
MRARWNHHRTGAGVAREYTYSVRRLCVDLSWVANKRSMIDFSSENLQTMPAIRFGIGSMAISLSIIYILYMYVSLSARNRDANLD